MFKFCRKFDEDENAYVGGVTICEALTNCVSKKKQEDQQAHVEQIVIEVDQVVDDEYADAEAAVKETVRPADTKPQNKCVICCRAFFFCKTANTVTKDMELAQIKLAASTLQAAKGEKDMEATTTNFAEAAPETQALLTVEPQSDAVPEKAVVVDESKIEGADEVQAEDEIESESSEEENEESEEAN